MLSASRHLRPLRTGALAIARITLALLLLVVLLAGVLPLGSLASAHECGMACCAGKPAHMAGSCSVAFETEEDADAETPAAPVEEHSSHHHHAAHSSAATPATQGADQADHAAKKSSAHHSKGSVKSSHKERVVTAKTMTTPCSPGCAAAASFGSSQGRRPRELASLVITLKPRAPTGRLFNRSFTVPVRKSAEARRRLRPRAPPSLLHNLSA